MSGASSSAFSRVEQSVRRRTSVSPRIAQEPLFAESPPLTLRPSYLRGKYDTPQRDLDLLKTPLLRVGDDEELDGQPTVLLVKKSLSSIGLEDSRILEHLRPTEKRDDLEPIPLTPRPELQTRAETASSAITRNSDLPRLPTPDFASPRLGVLDYLRGGNVENTRFTSTGSVSGSVRAGFPSPLQGIPPLSISTISERAPQLKDYLTASTSGSSGPSPPRLSISSLVWINLNCH